MDKENDLLEKDNIITEQSSKTLDPKFKKEIDDVKQVIQQTVMDFHNYIFPKYINNYKKYLWFIAERIKYIDAWQSNVNYPMVSSSVDQMFSNIFDFWYEFWINEEALKRLCTKAFDFRDAWKNTLKETAKECLITWRWFARDFFINEIHKDKYFWKEIKTNIKMPTLEYVSVFDVMYDKSKSINNSSYKIIRTFMTWDSIRKKLFPLILESSWLDKTKANNKLDKILSSYKDTFWSRFSMYDYNPVKSLFDVTTWMNSDFDNSFFSLPICSSAQWLLSWYQFWNNANAEDSKNYFLNANKSTYEVVEYMTCDKKYVFVNGCIVYVWNRKYQLSEIREITYSIIPGTWSSLWLSDKLWEMQSLQNMLWNAFADNLKLLLWPMFAVQGNLPIAKSGKIDFWALRAFKTNWAQSIEKIQLWVSDFAPINFMQMVEWVWVKESWMNNYISGWAGTIERTPDWVNLKWNQYKSRLSPITDSIDQMMWGIARSWIQMYLKFFTREELAGLWIQVTDVYTTNDEWISKFKTFNINSIDIKTIIDENNITFTYNSLYRVTKENARDIIVSNLQPILQYAGNKVNMEEIALILAGKDFNPEKLFKAEQTQQAQPDLQWQSLPGGMTPNNIAPSVDELPIEQQLPENLSDEMLMEELANIS